MGDLPTRHRLGRCDVPATLLGFGSAPLGNMFRPIEEDEAHASLEAAWQGGMRVFDTAPFYGYGLAERRLGDFLRTKPRGDYILSTKVGRMLVPRRDQPPTDTFFLSTLPFNPVYDYGYDAAMRSHDDSLQRMGLDRFDVLLIHDTGVAEHGDRQPEVFKEAIGGAAKALAKLRDEGAVGSIGMGTNEWEVAQAAIEAADFDTMLVAGRYTLLEQHSAKTFLPLCEKRGVNLMLGGVFNSGLLVSPDIKEAMWNYKLAPKELVERALQLRAVCERHDVPLPAAALQFAMAHPLVATALVGIRSKRESDEALKWSKMGIPAGLWADLRDEDLIPTDLPVPA